MKSVTEGPYISQSTEHALYEIRRRLLGSKKVFLCCGTMVSKTMFVISKPEEANVLPNF
jgi:hypothetical protein